MRKLFAFILYIYIYFRIKRISKDKNTILSIYGHNPESKSIEKVINWLIKKGYNFISPIELVDLINGKIIIDKPVWLSFDDGWKNNYYELLPLVEKYKIPFTIFVSTKAIDDGYFWWNIARENRDSNMYKTIDSLWTMPNQNRKDIISMLPLYKGERMAMNREELKKISESDYIYIANHTDDHVICDTCKNEELEKEILKCESKIKEITDKDCFKIFSYPNGDFDNQSIEVLKELDYKLAVTTNLGFYCKDTGIYELPRNVLPDNASLYESILNIYGLWTPFFNGIKKMFRIKSKK